MIDQLSKHLLDRVTRDLVIEPYSWSQIGPDHHAAYFGNIPLVAVSYENNPDGAAKHKKAHGWHTYWRRKIGVCGYRGPFETKEAARLMALIEIRMFLIQCYKDLRIDWTHTPREGGHSGDWHAYAHGIEIAHIFHCDGKGKDYQATRQWKGWFGAGIFGQGDDDSDQFIAMAKSLVGQIWVRWFTMAHIVADWPNPFFEPPTTFVWGEIHKERRWGGQMLVEGDGI